MRLRDLPNSVTARLIAGSVAILVITIATIVVGELLSAQARIGKEERSSRELADLAIRHATDRIAEDADAVAAFRALARELDAVRHIKARFVPTEEPLDAPPATPRARLAPAWFAARIAPLATSSAYPLTASGGRLLGRLVVTDDPGDEIDEIWDGIWHEVVGLVIGALLITAAVVWVVRHALRPIKAVADGMERLAHGQFVPLGSVDAYELRALAGQFDALATSLQRAGADNRLLIDRMMTLQEDERGEIARELHDEVGSALFSIRAGLVALHQPGGADDRVADLDAMIGQVQRRNGRLLERLRPMALDHLSLADALRGLVAARASRPGGPDWLCDIEDDIEAPDSAGALAVYRVVQECMTNAARHAMASWVEVRARTEATTGRLRVEVADDGIGPPADLRMGYGLLGATERVQALGGTLRVRPRAPRGMLVAFDLPTRRAGQAGPG